MAALKQALVRVVVALLGLVIIKLSFSNFYSGPARLIFPKVSDPSLLPRLADQIGQLD